MESQHFLKDYDGGRVAAHTETDGLPEVTTGAQLDDFEERQKRDEAEREAILNNSNHRRRGKNSNSVTTIDEEASVRVLKGMFQLNLTRNSQIIARLKDLDHAYLAKKVSQEMGHRKQLSRDEFYSMLCRVLKDDFVNRRDANTLFSVFDNDKSGLVDAAEFLTGLLSLVSSGVDDIAFKFINTLLEGREKSTVNAFISRFELDVLVDAAQRYYSNDPEVVQVLGGLAGEFNFTHHLGRIPVMDLRQKILEDDDYRTIFENLPNPSAQIQENAAVTTVSTVTTDENEWLTASNVVADQFLNSDWSKQATAQEHDSPKWWTKDGTVYCSSDKNPYGEPVFLKEK